MGKAPQTDWLISLQSLLTTVVIAVFVITFIIQAFQIPSESMENTLLIGDYLLVDKLRYGGGGILDRVLPYRPIQRGDVIVFHYPVHPSEHFVKRVIGVPGDRIRIINRQVHVNGSVLRESYTRYVSPAIKDRAINRTADELFRDEFPRLDISAPGMEGQWWLQMRKLVEDGELIIPEGHYFVLGDNRDESSDSRYWGFVPRENIVGRPLLIYWSVRNVEDDDMPGPSSPGDKLYRFAYAVSHLFQLTRWDRTFRIIN